jgi:hydroxymethylglutaryl-CoA lyase
MSERNSWKLPEKVDLGDITVRDGLQALEHYFPTEEKVRLAEDLILAGYKHVEVTNFGHPKFLPQFKDADQVLEQLFNSERVGSRLKQNGGDVTVCAITINEKAVDRAIEFKAKHGVGPDYILQMVSTDENHHKVNSGKDLETYWKMTERCTKKAMEAGIKMCGTVSTIWGSPMKGSRVTDLKKGVEFSKRYLELGADYIEQADHDGSADPARVFEYFSMILDPEIMGKWADPKYHLAHFHTSRGMGLANYLAALQAGIVKFETTLSGTGGQPANTVDGKFTGGTGAYYHEEHLYAGLVPTEDFAVMCEAMGVDTGLDLHKLLEVGRRFKREFIDISAEERKTLLANASESTGIPVEELEALEHTKGDLDGVVDKAVKNKTSADDDEKTVRKTKKKMHGLINSLRLYLQWNQWGPSRSESIISGLPPSPKLAELIGE